MKQLLLAMLINVFLIKVYSQTDKIKVFLSCNCDDSYIKQNTLLLDYVRDRTLSDIEVFVFDISNASGGRNFTFEYKGKNDFQNKENKISTNITQNLTFNEAREVLLKTYKMGMVHFLQNTVFQNQVDVSFNDQMDIPQEMSFDQWKNWVFEISGSFNFENEESINEEEYNVGFDIDRVTEIWRVRSFFRQRRAVKFFSGDEENFTSERNSTYFSGSLVKSISDHFSTGIFGSYQKDTFRNYKSFFNFSPALEYNFIPYNEVLTREITLAYKLGYNFYEYLEETLYGFLDQKMFNQSLTLNLRFREKWGSIYSYMVASQFLDQPDQNRLTLNNNINLRIVRGLSLRISGSFQLIRDQINLPKGEASIEDLLLRQRQISTNYQNRISMGLSYTFGSIFNNIVNTRL
ncbi:MAG: hypothetical protein P8I34_05635 [Flavobacteriaceae bacterium]|nr:hypothetical protein [Flavobacteriaceae bacterium]MDG1966100.1 hypothetical protein [Flavobacteriaceae bacterium]